MATAGEELAILIEHRLKESGQTKHLLASAQVSAIARAANLVVSALRGGNQVLLFGNGGSAADAQHIAAEFVGRYDCDRGPLPAVALTADSSVLTSIGNDFGYEDVFARQVRALGHPGDVALGISTGGTSRNVNAAIEAARDAGLRTIGLTGKGGGELARLVEVAVIVPSRVTARIQEAHITVGHILAEIVDWQIFGMGGPPPRGHLVHPRVVHRETLVELRREWAEHGQRVVWTNGCFDLLHVGHVRSLEAAKAFGDILIVGVNSDRSVTALKGAGRPVMPVEERAELLASLACVDFVVTFDELTPEAILADVRPDVHCKGGDYSGPGKTLPERAVVEGYGGRVEILPYVSARSTTALLDRLAGHADDSAQSIDPR